MLTAPQQLLALATLLSVSLISICKHAEIGHAYATVAGMFWAQYEVYMLQFCMNRQLPIAVRRQQATEEGGMRAAKCMAAAFAKSRDWSHTPPGFHRCCNARHAVYAVFTTHSYFPH